MPRNGSGQYNPLTNTWNPPVTGVLATGADFQAQLNDISAAITQSVSKDGQTPMTANLPMGNNSIVGIASGTETSPSISANGDTNTGVYFPAADTVGVAVGGVNVGNFTSAGFSGNAATSTNATNATNATNLVNGNATLAAGTATTPSLTTTGDDNTGLYFPAADTVAIATGGVKRVEVDANGNLGIATTSPTSKLHVKGSFRIESEGAQWFSIGAGASKASYGAFYKGGTTTNVGFIGTDGGGMIGGGTGDNFGIRAESALLLAAGATERARITSYGNLLVGTTSATDPNIKMEVVNYGISGCYLANNPTSAGTNHTLFAAKAIGVDRFWVLGNGNVANQNNSYGGISDAKLKENIVDTAPKLDSLLKVRIVNYNLKTDPQFKQIGVIAQELEHIFPSMIEEMPDRDDEGNDLGTVTKSVKYSVFVPILIKAIQEQQALIEAQKTAIESLTARITALEAK